jgi:hypothetical protein
MSGVLTSVFLHDGRVRVGLGAFLGVLVLSLTGPVRAGEADERFFETKIRPLLAEHCWKCHGPRKQEGGVRLDGPDYLRQDRDDGGPVVVPGKPNESPLIRAIRRTGKIAMPPKKPLPAEAVRDLTQWVQQGCHWPQVVEHRQGDSKRHWAFKPVRLPAVPAVRDTSWEIGPIDRFVLARLEARGLRPSPPADRRTLLRRVTFDLIGLPPTPEEVDAFVADDSPNAYEKVVERLLASPYYGERWGRHWLDVARYADSKDAENLLPFAYTYRDWVIQAFNEDRPYDEFLQLQIAADHLSREPGNPELAALGFLTLGRGFNNEPDLIDDRLDVLGRGLLGLSIGCARCHDHKYDPIPTQDYYSLYGVFAGAREEEAPLFHDDDGKDIQARYTRELRARQRALAHFLAAQRRRLFGDYPRQADRYLLAAARGGEPAAPGTVKRKDGLLENIVELWRNHLKETHESFDPIFGPWHALADLKEDRFADEAPKLARAFAANEDEDKKLNPHVARLFSGPAPASLDEVARRYGRLFARIDAAWKDACTEADRKDATPPEALEDTAADEIRKLFHGEETPLAVDNGDLNALLSAPLQRDLERLEEQIDDFKDSPEAPPQARVLVDPYKPALPHVFVRGMPGALGEEVPRQFLTVLSGHWRRPFEKGTGRLELAQAITSPTNPLTARVWVNRVWMHHFGQGLVTTPSDFGVRGDPPSHPELLDWLAHRFVAGGWSTKKLHRLIVLSQTYRQAGADRPDGHRLDPDNRLLWRMNRRRLELEPFRDSLLAVADHLDQSMGGRSMDLAEEPEARRRTVYARIRRQQLPALFRTFDFANPDLHCPKRHETTGPQQALFLLNSPFIADQARGVVRRLAAPRYADEAAFARQVYRRLFSREATAAEVETARRFLRAAEKLEAQGPERAAEEGRPLSAREKYVQVLLLTNEMQFVD